MREKTNGSYIMKRILSVILALAVTVSAVQFGLWAADDGVATTALTDEGSGEQGDPYLISTAEQLRELAKDNTLWDKHFKLMADIDLGGEANGTWKPIGDGTKQFTGSFDGDGHMITGLYISSKNAIQGLFGDTNGTIQNLGVFGSVTGTAINSWGGGNAGTIGGIAAQSSGTIQNCYFVGSISGGDYIGGIVGINNKGIVQNCYFSGSVEGASNVGGIAGQDNSETDGLDWEQMISGGDVLKSEASIAYCYNNGKVSGTSNVGGIVGYYLNDNPAITNCYNVGDVSGTTSNTTGTIFGSSRYSSVYVYDCYIVSDTNGGNGIAFGGYSPYNKDEFNESLTINTILGRSNWSFSSFLGRPVLNANPEIPGDGTSGSPYKLSTAEHLKALAARVNEGNATYKSACYELTADITADTPITEFSGTFDGNGHTITLNISVDSSTSLGLFNKILNGAVIENLGVSGSFELKGNAGFVNAGVIVGWNQGTVQNCYNSASVKNSSSSSSSSIGGIVGANDGGIVKNCYNTGSITSANSSKAGGIAGTNDSTIQNCYYLASTANNGIGSGTGEATSKTETDFKFGEVAWLLQNGQTEQAWGQELTGDTYPIPTTDITKKVCKVEFEIDGIVKDSNTKFVNYGGTVDFPTVNDKEITGWQADGKEFTDSTPVTGDIKVTAVITVEPPSLGTVTIEKGKDYIKITLTPSDDKIEFYINGTDKTSKTGEFTGLTAGTTYEIYARYEGSDGVLAATVTTVSNDGTTTVKPGETAVTDKGKVTNDGEKVTVTDGDNTTEVTLPSGVDDVEMSDGTVKAPGGSTVKGASGQPDITLTDGGEVAANGDITVSENDRIKVGDTTVTVTEGGTVERNTDGSVTVPDGSTVTAPDGTEITVGDNNNDKATVDQNGNVTVPKGGKVEIGDTTVTVTEGGTITPDSGSVTVPDGSVITPPSGKPEITVEESNGGNATVDENGKVGFPGGGTADVGGTTVVVPDDGELEPVGDGFVKVPVGSTIGEGGETLDSDGVLDSTGNTYEGAEIIDDVLFIPPQGQTVTKNDDGTVSVPEGTTVVPKDGSDYTVGKGGGKVTTSDGSVDLPEGGSVKVGNTTVTVPDGGEVVPNEDGVTVPDGSVVSSEGAPDITVEGNGQVSVGKNGSVTVPEGGQIEIGDTTVTVTEGGTVTPTEDGVTVPDGSVVTTPDGSEITVGDNNNDKATVGEDGSVTVPKGGQIEIGDTTVTVTEGGTVTPTEGGVTVPDGTLVQTPGAPDITVGDNNNGEATVGEDGSVELPGGGSAQIGDTTVTVPEDGGGTITPTEDGVTVPDGTLVQTPGAPDITVGDNNNGEATVGEDGSVTLPEGGSAKVGESTVTVPEEGGTITPAEDGVILPGGSTVTDEEGNEQEVPEEGGVYDPESGELSPIPEEDEDPDNPDNPDNPEEPDTPENPDNPDNPEAPDDSDGDNSDDNSDDNSGDTPDVIDPDSVTVTTDSGENAPSVSIDEASAAKLIEEVIAKHLTEEERAAVENGASLEIVLSVEVMEATASDGDRQTAEAAIAGTDYIVGQYLSLELIKVIDGEQTSRITELDAPISIVIDIPEELRAENRVFAVVRVHEGEAEILADTDSSPDTVTVQTDRFSTYALVYQDTENNDEDNNKNTGVVLAIAPFITAAAGVILSRKRK